MAHSSCSTLYNLCENYFNGRSAALILNSRKEQRPISKGCPQGSASGPGLWNIQFNSLLQLEITRKTKLIAYADDLLVLTKRKTQEVENHANIELAKITKWARENKMTFNEQKSKMMVITRRRPKNKREYKIYLHNTPMQQEETIKYLGIIIDKKIQLQCAHRLHDREKYQANSRPFKVGQGQLGTTKLCTPNDILRSNITHSVIWNTSMNREPAEEKRYKNQENSEADQHQNRESILHLVRSRLCANRDHSGRNRTGK